MVRDLMIQPKDGGDCFCVANGAAQDHANGGCQGQQAFVNHFVGFGLGFSGVKAGREIYGHGFGDESRAGIKVQDEPPVIGGVSGFLKQLALGGAQSLFTSIDASGRKLPEIVVGGMAILALKNDAWGGARFVDRQHNHRTGVMNDLPVSPDPAGFLHFVDGHPEDGTAIYRAGGDDSRFCWRALGGLGRLRLGAHRLSHQNNIKHCIPHPLTEVLDGRTG